VYSTDKSLRVFWRLFRARAVSRFPALFSPAAITQTVRLRLCLEEIVAFVTHARVPDFGIGFPGVMSKLVGIRFSIHDEIINEWRNSKPAESALEISEKQALQLALFFVSVSTVLIRNLGLPVEIHLVQ
jgi:hypothetical protein